MKIRESGMPEETYWESFFDTRYIFSQMQLDNKIYDVAEFGSGYGTFTIPAAKIIRGNLYAFDIDATMIDRLKKRISEQHLSNIKVMLKDFVKEGTKLKDCSIDYAMLFNILHAEKPVALLNEAYRMLKPGGRVGVIHWIHSETTPRGPSMDIRPSPLQCVDWLLEANFEILKNEIQLPPYHYGIIGMKSPSQTLPEGKGLI
ncbi:MAG: class I SAM-dependent methyltransferase [Ignavibacteria bacterium]|nr:class I SAM-dependent methyltransferase [Ignavibacteria bacterium]